MERERKAALSIASLEDGSPAPGIDGIAITNGPAVSPDGRILYLVDTLKGTIDARRNPEDGASASAGRSSASIRRTAIPTGRRSTAKAASGSACTPAGSASLFARRRTCRPRSFPGREHHEDRIRRHDLRTAYATTARQMLTPEDDRRSSRRSATCSSSESTFRSAMSARSLLARIDIPGRSAPSPLRGEGWVRGLPPIRIRTVPPHPALSRGVRLRACRYVLILSALLASSAIAAPTIDPQFGDHAVIQRDKPIVLSGTAAPSERAERHCSGEQPKSTTPTPMAGGRRRFPPRTAGALHNSGQRRQRRGGADDIAIGDVWLCSGQSNMEYPLRRALNGDGEVQGSRRR